MRIGIPKEIKAGEHRVSCTPDAVHMLVQAGHSVRVQSGAGASIGFDDDLYAHAGATLVPTAADAWSSDMVIKVKEPVASEYPFLRPDLCLFTYLHLAADRPLTETLMKSRTAAIAYETVTVGHTLPLLEPMSEVAGRMSIIVGAHYLSRAQAGRGVLLGGVPGVLPGRVTVLGGGIAGLNAARMAMGLGAEVVLLDINLERLREIDNTHRGAIRTLFSNEHNLRDLLPGTDLLIGSVLLPGARAPKLIRRDMLARMPRGSVIVDISIDQGGCTETSRPTTHQDPVFTVDGVVHYCVANMPSAYARTSTQALGNATIPYAMKLANLGLEGALQGVPALRPGVNTLNGRLVCEPVAAAHGLPFSPLS